MSSHDIIRAERRQERRDAAARRDYRQTPDLVGAFLEVFGRDLGPRTDTISLEVDPDDDDRKPR